MRLLSARLIISLIVGITVVSLCTSYYQVLMQSRSMRKDLERRAEVLGESLARNVERDLARDVPERADSRRADRSNHTVNRALEHRRADRADCQLDQGAEDRARSFSAHQAGGYGVVPSVGARSRDDGRKLEHGPHGRGTRGSIKGQRGVDLDRGEACGARPVAPGGRPVVCSVESRTLYPCAEG